tara:strand:+ start:31005 stop:31190 length:186 start_codon:yes stop_codon:yes gene_type:complete
MTIKVLQNKLFKLQMEVIELNQQTLETCKFGDVEDTLKVWRALNNSVECLEDARVLIHQNK